jgi:hypothetical protein
MPTARPSAPARDVFLDFTCGGHHQVGEFIDDNHNVGKRIPFVIQIVGFQTKSRNRQLANLFVVRLEIAHAAPSQFLVARFHFNHGPAQRVLRNFRLRNNWNQKMRNILIKS